MKESQNLEKYLEKYIENLFQGSILNFTGEVAKRLGGYIYQVAIVRLLGTFIYGIYTLSYTLINVVLRISQLGLDRGGIRYIAILKEEKKFDLIKKLVIFLLLLSISSGLLWGLITFLSSSFLANIYKKPALKNGLIYFSIVLPFYTSLLVMAYSSRGFNKMQYYVVTENFMRPFLQFLFLFILFYWFGKTIPTAILPWAFSSFLALITIVLFFKKELKNKRNGPSNGFGYREVITFSLPVTLISILYFIFAWTDLIILGFFRPAEKIGIYNGVARTAEMTNLFLLSINEVFSPLVSQLSHKKDFNSLKRIFRVIIRWSLYFSLPLYIFFIFSGKYFLGSVFGKEFITGYIPMVILLSGLIFQNITGPVAMTLTMSGYQKEWAFINFIGLFINISLALLFIPKLGILGASVSTCLSLVILRSIGIIGVKKFLKFKTHDIKVIKPLLQGTITLLIIGALNLFLLVRTPLNPLIKILVNFSLSYLIYFLLFIFIKPENEEIFLLNKLKGFLKKN